MASAEEITRQIVNLNAVVTDLQTRASEMKNVIERQHARIGQLEGQFQAGGGGQGHDKRRFGKG